MAQDESDRIALIDLDGTVADYDKALAEAMRTIQAPEEEPYVDRFKMMAQRVERPHVEARRKMIQRVPGFWRNLERLELGFHVVDDLRAIGFQLHVLSKGPRTNAAAWGEKLEWSAKHIPDATVCVTEKKTLTYGRILFDDFPPYFLPWLEMRPRGLVVCIAHPWNESFAFGGSAEHPNIFRYDGTNREVLRAALQRAHDRASGEALYESASFRPRGVWRSEIP